MPHFLGSLFGWSAAEPGRLPPALIDAAIERAVDGTDRRLRALGKYRKRLRAPVATAVQHVIELIDALPPVVEMTPGNYGSDPRLRMAFVSPDHLNDTLTRFWTVRDYLSSAPRPLPDDIFGLLTMRQHEQRVLGMELDGGLLKRDVLQTAVSFTDHQFLAPAAGERRTRRELKRRAFDFLLSRAKEELLAAKASRSDLVKQRRQLRSELETLEIGEGRRPSRGAGSPPADAGFLQAQIHAIDAELGPFGKADLSLEDSLRRLEAVLGEPQAWLSLRTVRLSLDYRGIRRDEEGADALPPVELVEIASSDDFRRIVMLGRIPRVRFPIPADVVKRGQAYLG